jgi:hypothetical protein
MVERSLSMREAPGSIPGLSMYFCFQLLLSPYSDHSVFCLQSVSLGNPFFSILFLSVLSKTMIRQPAILVLQGPCYF